MSYALKEWLSRVEIPKYAQTIILTFLDDLALGSHHDTPGSQVALRKALRVLKDAAGATIDEHGVMSTAVLAKNIKRITSTKDASSVLVCLLDELADALYAATSQRGAPRVKAVQATSKSISTQNDRATRVAKVLAKLTAARTGRRVEALASPHPLVDLLDKALFPAVAGTKPRASRRLRLHCWATALETCKSERPEELLTALSQADPSISKGRDGSVAATVIQSWCDARQGLHA